MGLLPVAAQRDIQQSCAELCQSIYRGEIMFQHFRLPHQEYTEYSVKRLKTCLIDWLIDWLISCLVDWSIDWIRMFQFYFFWQAHKVMFKGNSQLKAREDETSVSRPWQWPINLRGQFFSGGKLRIYLLGNPVIWWGNIVVWLLYAVLEITTSVLRKRGILSECDSSYAETLENFLPACRWIFIGWATHYLPFYVMGRILYYHHYFPAHLFACMLTGKMNFFLLFIHSVTINF